MDWGKTEDNRHKRARMFEELGYDLFRARGYMVYHIANHGDPGVKAIGVNRDEGDLLVYRHAPEPNSHEVCNIRVVDVKEKAQWSGGDWPSRWKTIMLTEGHVHPDWLYLCISADGTQGVLVDMREVPYEEITETETVHGSRTRTQMSKEVPVKYGKFFDIDKVLLPGAS